MCDYNSTHQEVLYIYMYICMYICIYIYMLVALSCLTLGDPMDCSPSGSSLHGIPQARTLEWIAIPFSKGSS